MPDNAELLDYLKTHTAYLQTKNEVLQRQAGKWAIVAYSLIVVLFFTICTFSLSVFLITQENTKQLQAVFNAKWEVEATEVREKHTVTQEATVEASGEGATATQTTTQTGIQNNPIK